MLNIYICIYVHTYLCIVCIYIYILLFVCVCNPCYLVLLYCTTKTQLSDIYTNMRVACKEFFPCYSRRRRGKDNKIKKIKFKANRFHISVYRISYTLAECALRKTTKFEVRQISRIFHLYHSTAFLTVKYSSSKSINKTVAL